MRGVSIIGIGTTRYGILEGQSIKEMATFACNDAIHDAGIDRKQIEAFYLGNYISGMIIRQETLAPLVGGSIGLRKEVPCTKVEGACSSASIALRHGYLLIAAGVYDIVLVAGAEKMSSAPIEKLTASLGASIDMETEGLTGLTFPGFWALMARRHMHEFGTTIEQLAMVAVKNHKNGSLNPRARFRNIITLENVINSRLITDPLKLYDCCPISDGASAAVLCASHLAKEFSNNPVEIVGSVQTTGFSTLFEQGQQISLPATILAGKLAFEMSGLKPQDIDIVEIHDCFTPAEIVDSEDLGFFEKGKGGWAVLDGVTQPDGKLPINPSGGLLCKGHPVGATGLGQIYEVVRQLRDEHENQIKGAQIGLTHNAGGTGAVCTVHILKRR
ncbi:MAG: acetyl-CoA acetyltransferase [Deltaproteobacteria bacterium RBG_16_47_11]|nr:MAG: acetyl-CoA acetyltransferase [Deltaproteobacteria bacterium RBG_16_47_11]